MSELLKNWSIYVTAWRKTHGYSKTKFSNEAQMDPRALRDLEDQHFQSRFYSVASTAEYIRHENLMKQLAEIHVVDPEIYLPLIEKLDTLAPSKRQNVQNLFIEHFQLLKEKQEIDAQKPSSHKPGKTWHD